ncbi:hypothetical protein Nepgr_012207 [Nepenthes gracilis]|uniref:CHHC U11-48K-type domain-containing protein n=1 Tax=Nepenthes gracilis TaxID=150966 RepID=A0AAD3XN29_NEPGR|nr:hypothetical protein Nepgr_012207 [Nepenthes gracilis]
MNPPPPFPISQFYFNPSNPNPSPNLSISVSHCLSHSSQFQAETAFPDLPSTLSLLDNLLHLSHSYLDSLSSLFPTTSAIQQSLSPSSEILSQCPSNPSHWMPAERLFLHSLHCPSPLDTSSILDSLHYPKTLKSEDQLIEQNKFVQPLHDPITELCFSLDDFIDFDSNFFYQDCPGVVSSASSDGTKRMFSLPGVLSVECANFACDVDREVKGLQKNYVKLLPSEVWVIRCEIEQWNDFPNSYSHFVHRAFLGLQMVKECDLSVWVIANSPSFGVVIDVSMRDHIFVLVKLCLKAVIREAIHSSKFFSRGLDKNGGEFNPESLSFKCPILLDAFKWLTSQLSILFGEANAKSFAVGILKHLLLNASSNLLLWPFDQQMAGTSAREADPVNLDTDVNTGQSPGKIVESAVHDRACEGIFSMAIFVYQVGAAIAALYERSLLEVRIRALRNPQPLTAYQRAAEHAYWSKKADEERQKHPNYRPLLEHDGLPSQSSSDQETTNRIKTREELLAEERDYKRRRMSYRGKKLKRTTKEVMRDIIVHQMEAIKQAGGIGCFAKGDQGGGSFPSESLAGYGNITHDKLRGGTSEVDETHREQRHGCKKQLHSDYNARLTSPMDAPPDRYARQNRGSCEEDEELEVRRTTRKHEDKYYTRSPDRSRSDGLSREQASHHRDLSSERRSHRREHGVDKVDENRHYKSKHVYSNMSKYDDRKSRSSMSRFASVFSGRKDKQELVASGRHRQKRHEMDGSESLSKDDFEDRYDPSESHDAYDYELSSDSKYIRPETLGINSMK